VYKKDVIFIQQLLTENTVKNEQILKKMNFILPTFSFFKE